MNKRVLVIVLGVVFALAAAVFSLFDSEMDTVPESLQGLWVTDDSRYEACYIDLTEEFVEIGTGDWNSFIAKVAGINMDSEHQITHYNIEYYDSLGEQYVLSITYDPSEGGTFRLKRPMDVLWRRES